MKVLDYDFSKGEVGFVIIILVLILACGVYAWNMSSKDQVAEASISSFDECVAAGNPVMESYPEQCAAGGQTFTNPDQQVVSDTPAASDQESIQAAVLNYCTSRDQVDPDTVKQSVSNSMSDPSLYINESGFVSIAIGCETEGGGFRLYLQKQPDNTWKVLGATQEETLSCDNLDGTGIPESVAKNCYDENGELRAIKPAA